MKKVAYLFTIVIAITLMSFSCEKNDDDIPNVITVNDLVGDWNFQSLTFNGVVYDTETELDELDLTYDFIEISLVGVTTSEMGILNHRASPNPYDNTYTLSNNTINFDNGKFVFDIDNWETFDGTVLEVKLKSSIYHDPSAGDNMPINGVYTMTR